MDFDPDDHGDEEKDALKEPVGDEDIETGQVPGQTNILDALNALQWDATVHLEDDSNWACTVVAIDEVKAEDAAEEAYLIKHPDADGIFDIHAISVEPHEGNEPPAEPAGGTPA